MAFLGKGKKENLKTLVDEMELARTGNETRIQLKHLVLESDDYEEEYVQALYETILATAQEELVRKESESARLQAIEREDRLRKETIAREEVIRKEKLEQEKELKELELKNKFELEKLRIEKGIAPSPENANNIPSRPTEQNLKKLIPDFNPEKTDISLYLVLFERQAKRVKIPKENWVSHLIGLLPVDIISIIARQPETESEDYDNIKSILLKKFKLNPESFRQKFVSHQKSQSLNWQDFGFEIRNYLNEWLAGLEITSLDELKDLLVTDQIKRRVKFEIREHFIDKWPLLKTEAEIVELLDGYDSIRASYKKNRYAEDGNTRPKSDEKQTETKNETPLPSASAQRDTMSREKAFGKRVERRCFHCNSRNHLRNFCPELNRNSGSRNTREEVETEAKARVSYVGVEKLNSRCVWDNKRKAVGIRKVPLVDLNILGRKVKGIKDSGTELSIFRGELIPDKYKTGEQIELIPAIGKIRRADLAKVPISLWNGNQENSPRIVITAAVVPELNCEALLTPCICRRLFKFRKPDRSYARWSNSNTRVPERSKVEDAGLDKFKTGESFKGREKNEPEVMSKMLENRGEVKQINANAEIKGLEEFDSEKVSEIPIVQTNNLEVISDEIGEGKQILRIPVRDKSSSRLTENTLEISNLVKEKDFSGGVLGGLSVRELEGKSKECVPIAEVGQFFPYEKEKREEKSRICFQFFGKQFCLSEI